MAFPVHRSIDTAGVVVALAVSLAARPLAAVGLLGRGTGAGDEQGDGAAAKGAGSTGDGRSLRRFVGIGAGTGATAYLSGYVVTYVFAVIDGVSTDALPTWIHVGRIYYNAHFVDTRAVGEGRPTVIWNLVTGYTHAVTGDLSAAVGSTVPTVLYHLVPAVVLVGAGYLSWRLASGHLDAIGALNRGASVVFGYLVLTLVGAFLFTTSPGSSTVGPTLRTAALQVGVIYPVVFGGLGGLGGLAHGRLASRTAGG